MRMLFGMLFSKWLWLAIIGFMIYAYGAPATYSLATGAMGYVIENIGTFAMYGLLLLAIHLTSDLILERIGEFFQISFAFALFSAGAHLTSFQFFYLIFSFIVGMLILRKVAKTFKKKMDFDEKRFWGLVAIFYVTALFIPNETMFYSIAYTILMYVAIARLGHILYKKTNISEYKELNNLERGRYLKKITSFKKPILPLILMGFYLIMAIWLFSSYFGLVPITMLMAGISLTIIFSQKALTTS